MPLPSKVIIIQADDLGIDDLGCRGNPLAYTPHIDALSKGCANVMDFTVNPVCAPSRATLLAGRHFLRTGVSHVHGGKDYLHWNERTLADCFKQSGWRTGMWGKWHLGRGKGYDPWERGFEEAYAARLYDHKKSCGHLNGEYVEHDAWADEVMTRYAMDFLKRTQDEPAFLYLPTMTPHTPLEAPQNWIDFHQARGLNGNLGILFAMVSFMDACIGRLIGFLRDQNQLDSSLILFTSDNGAAVNRGILTDHERKLRKTSSRRGWKGDIWENGVRAPLLIHWPDGLTPSVIQQPFDQVDILPTLLDWCNLTWPSEFPRLDGASRTDLLIEPASKPGHYQEKPIFNYAHPGWITSDREYDQKGIPGEYNPVSPDDKPKLVTEEQAISVRHGRYKLLLNPCSPELNRAPDYMLVDLYNDPGECDNLMQSQPKVFASLKSLLGSWFDEMRREPNAFTAPVFTTVAQGVCRIPARMPYRLDGDFQNTVTLLEGWHQEGMAASYHLCIINDVRLRVVANWSRNLEPGIRFLLSIGAAEVEATSDGEDRVQFPVIGLSRPASVLDMTLKVLSMGTTQVVEVNGLVNIDLIAQS